MCFGTIERLQHVGSVAWFIHVVLMRNGNKRAVCARNTKIPVACNSVMRGGVYVHRNAKMLTCCFYGARRRRCNQDNARALRLPSKRLHTCLQVGAVFVSTNYKRVVLRCIHGFHPCFCRERSILHVRVAITYTSIKFLRLSF